jgi:hypothetical protein
VRAIVVHGMPSTVCRSRGRMVAPLWTVMPARARPVRVGLMTSNVARLSSRSPRWQAEDRCERAPPGPQARTAASPRPLRVRSGWPTEKTPECTRCSAPAVTRLRTALALRPSSTSWWSAMTPCWRPATSAIRASSLGCGGKRPASRRFLPDPSTAAHSGAHAVTNRHRPATKLPQRSRRSRSTYCRMPPWRK